MREQKFAYKNFTAISFIIKNKIKSAYMSLNKTS